MKISKDKIFWLVLLIMILVSIILTYRRYIILENFEYFTEEENIPSFWEIVNILKI